MDGSEWTDYRIACHIRRTLDEGMLDVEINRIRTMLIAFAKYPSDNKAVNRERIKNFTRLFQTLIGVKQELLAKNAREEAVNQVGKNDGGKTEDPRPDE
jgi:translation initiation factor RLI1